MKIYLIGNEGRLQNYILRMTSREHEVKNMSSNDAFNLLFENRCCKDLSLVDAIIYLGGEVKNVSRMVRHNYTIPSLLATFASEKSIKFIYLSSQVVYARDIYTYQYKQPVRYPVYLASKWMIFSEMEKLGDNITHITVGAINSGRQSTVVERLTKFFNKFKFIKIWIVPSLYFSQSTYENIGDTFTISMFSRVI